MKDYLFRIRRISMLVLLMLTCHICFSHSLIGTIKGMNNEKLVLTNAYVLSSKDSSFVNGQTTDDNGQFKFDLKTGSYLLRISYVGYQTKWIPVELKADVDLGDISLKTLKGLDEVTVLGQRSHIVAKHDKVVFNVEDSYASNTSSNSYELLAKAPGLIVDPNNKTVNMVGKGALIVTINGEQLNMDGDALSAYLSTINPKDIKEIEVIDTPSSRYDAGGNAGVLNIVLKRKKQDYLGGVWANNYRKRSRGHDYGTNASVTLKKNKLSLNSSINYGLRKPISVTEMSQETPKALHIDENTEETRKSKMLGVRSQLNYDFSSSVSLGIGYSYLDNNYDGSYLGRQLVRNYNQNSNLFEKHYFNQYQNKEDKSAKVHNAFMQLDIVTNERGDKLRLQSGGVFSDNSNDGALINNVDNENVTVLDRQNRTDNSSDFKTFAADYFTKKKEGMNYSFGAKATLNNSDGLFNSYVYKQNRWSEDKTSMTHFIYKEKIFASYAEIDRSWDKFYLRMGLRAEYTKTKAHELKLDSLNENSYMRYFPNVIVGYNSPNGCSYTLSYNRRFTRPWVWALSPATNYSGGKYINKGNPFLQPMISDNIAFRFNRKRFIFSAGYIKETDMFNSNVVYYDKKKDLFVLGRFNNFEEDKVYINLDYSFSVKWWSCSLGSSTNWSYNKNTDSRFDIDSNNVWGSYFRINNDFKPFYKTSMKGLTFNTNFWYSSGSKGKREETFDCSNLSFAINWSTLKNKLNISLSASDVLNKQTYGFEMIQNNTTTYYRVNSDQKSVLLSLSYSFGGNLHFDRKQVNQKELNRL